MIRNHDELQQEMSKVLLDGRVEVPVDERLSGNTLRIIDTLYAISYDQLATECRLEGTLDESSLAYLRNLYL